MSCLCICVTYWFSFFFSLLSLSLVYSSAFIFTRKTWWMRKRYVCMLYLLIALSYLFLYNFFCRVSEPNKTSATAKKSVAQLKMTQITSMWRFQHADDIRRRKSNYLTNFVLKFTQVLYLNSISTYLSYLTGNLSLYLNLISMLMLQVKSKFFKVTLPLQCQMSDFCYHTNMDTETHAHVFTL